MIYPTLYNLRLYLDHDEVQIEIEAVLKLLMDDFN